ncbi:hypothetical protein [Streptomyces sp. NPDC046909]
MHRSKEIADFLRAQCAAITPQQAWSSREMTHPSSPRPAPKRQA